MKLVPSLTVALVLATLGACAAARAKCPLLLLHVDGTVRSATSADELTLDFQITPAPNAAQDAVPIEGGRLRTVLRFDSTRTGGRFRHDCSRQPQTVVVRLLRSGREVAAVSLDVKDDFVRDERGDYHLQSVLEVAEQE